MNELRFHFLNVGKGNCTIIDFPSKRLSVIDIDDSRTISSTQRTQMMKEGKADLTDPLYYIKSKFPDRDIFRFILTHPDMDHMSGLKKLFNNKKVSNFWDTRNNKSDPGNWDKSPYDKADWDFYQEIRGNESNPRVLNLDRGAKSECCWIQDGIEVVSPTSELVKEANESEDYDHLSYVLMVSYADKKILLGGDATQKAWHDILAYYGEGFLKSDVLFAPNHGSPNHMSKEVLDIINPDLTVVSVAEGVEYAYNLYSGCGLVLSTKWYGNIWVKVQDNGEIFFKTEFKDYNGSWQSLSQRKIAYLLLSRLIGK